MVTFGHSRAWIKDAQGQVMAMGTAQEEGIYTLDCQALPADPERANVAMLSIEVWHQRFGHLGEQNLKKLVSKEMVTGMEVTETKAKLPFCEPCVKGKLCRQASRRALSPIKATISADLSVHCGERWQVGSLGV